MKKVLSIVLSAVLVVAMCMSLAGCSIEILPGYTSIGYQSGTTGQYYVVGDEEWGFDGLTNCVSSGYDNGGLAVQDMINGNLDLVIIDEAPAKSLAESASFKGKIKVIDIALTEEEYAYGVNKADAELLTNINKIIADIKADGRYQKILDKYFNGEEITGIESGEKDLSKADQQLVVSTNASFAPFEYKIGDKFAGVDMEIAKIIADELGMELVIEDMEFASVVTSVGNNGVDVAMAGLTVNEKRKESVNFSDSYYNASQVIIVKADDTTFDECKTVEDVEAILNK